MASDSGSDFGDDLYGGRPLVMGDVLRQQDLAKLDSKSPKQLLLNRQALHSSVLTFTHPSTEERVQTHARAPQDMAAVVSLLRQYKLEQIVQADASAAVDIHRILPFDEHAVSARHCVRQGELKSVGRGALRADDREPASVPGRGAEPRARKLASHCRLLCESNRDVTPSVAARLGTLPAPRPLRPPCSLFSPVPPILSFRTFLWGRSGPI